MFELKIYHRKLVVNKKMNPMEYDVYDASKLGAYILNQKTLEWEVKYEEDV